MEIPLEIQEYTNEVVTVVGDRARSIWLFGSRANGRERPDSDWDLILFSDAEGLERLKRADCLYREKIDLLVAVDEDWISPWPDDEANQKKLSPTVLNWKSTGTGQASYLGRPKYKNRKEWHKEINPPREKLSAYQIWPTPMYGSHAKKRMG